MREMTITVTCDNCDEPVEGADGTYEGTPIRFGSSGELRVDLCQDCYQDMLDSLRPVLARGLKQPSSNGHRKPMPPRTKVQCPRCGKQVTMGAGMTLHARKKHPEESESMLVAEASRSIQEVSP